MGFVWGIADVAEGDFGDMGFGDRGDFVTKWGF
jgi:hypothetical protein